MVVSKRDNLRHMLCDGDVKIKHVQKLNYLGSVVINNGKWDTEKHIGIMKVLLQIGECILYIKRLGYQKA